MRFNSAIFAAVAAVASIAQVHSAHAGSISTGSANNDWKLVSIESLSDNSLTSFTNQSADDITRHSAWTSDFDASDASWISATSDGNQHGIWGWYTFQLTLTDLHAGSTYNIAGQFTADNMVDSFKINDREILLNLPAEGLNSFQTSYNLPNDTDYTDTTLNQESSSITLTVRVYNGSGYTPSHDPDGGHLLTDLTVANYPIVPGFDPFTHDNPVGFVLAGTITESIPVGAQTAVPTPAAAFSGLTLLSGLALSQLRRRAKQAE